LVTQSHLDHKNFKFGTKYYLIKLPYWTFDFEVEFPGVFANINGALGILIEQASNVPMITGLGEDTQHSWLIPEKNIFIQQLDNHTHELNQS
jgi:hypothetical protein